MHNHNLDRLLVTARHAKGARSAWGFGLIEMMIALVLGLIVSGSVIAFIGSVVRANAQTIRVTRLNQELRSASEMIGRELRRAQSVSEPLTNVGNPSGATCTGLDTPLGCHDKSIAVVNVTGSSCITYGYGGSGQGNYRAVWLDAGGNIELARGSSAQSCTDAATNPQLNSPLVQITAMTVAQNGSRIDLTLSGQMRGDTMVRLGDEATNPITRTYQTSLQIRTNAVP